MAKLQDDRHAASPRQQEKSRFLLDRITDYIVVKIISQISQRTKSWEGSRPGLSRAFGASFSLSDLGPVPTPEMLLEERGSKRPKSLLFEDMATSEEALS